MNGRRRTEVDDWPPVHPHWVSPNVTLDNIDHWLVRAGLSEAVLDACRAWRQELPEGARLLDVGAGSQPYRPWTEHIGLRYQAIERATEGETTADPSLLTWDLDETPWPLESEAFAALLCTELLEHVPDPDRVLAECARVTAPGALCLFTVPFVWPIHEAPHDHRRFTGDGLAHSLRKAGFSIERLWARGDWPSTMLQLLSFHLTHNRTGRAARALRAALLPAFALVGRRARLRPPDAYALPLGYAALARRQRQRKGSL